MIPEKAWLDGNPLYGKLFLAANSADRLRRQVHEAIHNALPEAVSECLVDEVMTAEHYGQAIKLQIKSQVDPAINVVLEAVKQLAVPYMAENGTACLMVPIDKIDSILP
jgi:hypothetical protein